MQSIVIAPRAHAGHLGPVRAAIVVAAAIWLGCSGPEAFRGQGGLTSTGAGGAAGQFVPPLVDASGVAGGVAGAVDAAAPTGVAGDPGGSGGANQAGSRGADQAGSSGQGAGAGGQSVAGSGGNATGTAGAGGVDAGAAGASSPPPTLTLPFDVSAHFAPTGFMGDGEVAGSVTMTTDGTACGGAPAPALVGACYTVVYHPQPIVAPAPTTWAGVYWQYPDDNWGAVMPQAVASGANDISFFAKGMAGGESVTFQAGGIINDPVTAATPYTDSFTIKQSLYLTTSWTKYTLSMTGLAYGSGVLGGFAWVATANNANPVTFYVTGIHWE
jgi:hypothetical protein